MQAGGGISTSLFKGIKNTPQGKERDRKKRFPCHYYRAEKKAEEGNAQLGCHPYFSRSNKQKRKKKETNSEANGKKREKQGYLAEDHCPKQRKNVHLFAYIHIPLM